MTSAPQFIGLDTVYPLADGRSQHRIHLDGAASPLAAQAAVDSIDQLLPHYSNTHSYVHNSAQICTQALHWAHATVLNVLSADRDKYTSVFLGNGCTAAINRVARGLARALPDKKRVLVSSMEHHANDLPHRQFDNQVGYIPLIGVGAEQGSVDVDSLQQILDQQHQQIRYIAVSAVSNVTGIINPIGQICELAHKYNIAVLVDAAQAVAHQQINLPEWAEPDFVVFSGHKVYTPMSPGVLIAKQQQLSQLSGQDLGGGSVSDVSYFDYILSENYPDREQSGTSNIVGVIALARVMRQLSDYGYAKIEKHNRKLLKQLYTGLASLGEIDIYGDKKADRIAALAFNHQRINHGLLAAILNDYYGIAVRNECFCAHPYVSSLLKETLWQLDVNDIAEQDQQAYINRKRGMVRASISLYNSSDDIDNLLAAIKDISQRIDDYRAEYRVFEDGSYQHKSFALDWQDYIK